jgi:hypothetical protein
MPKFVKGQSGNPQGRPPGIVEQVPRSDKAKLLALFQRLGGDTNVMGKVLRDGLNAKAPVNFPYFKLLVENNVGLPDQNLNLATKVVHEIHNSSSNRG